jgi:hypothetical protein
MVLHNIGAVLISEGVFSGQTPENRPLPLKTLRCLDATLIPVHFGTALQCDLGQCLSAIALNIECNTNSQNASFPASFSKTS